MLNIVTQGARERRRTGLYQGQKIDLVIKVFKSVYIEIDREIDKVLRYDYAKLIRKIG